VIKLSKERYLVSDSWVGLDDRYWFKIVKKTRLFRKPVYEIKMINRQSEFDTKEKAIEYAKHILWCLVIMIKRDE